VAPKPKAMKNNNPRQLQGFSLLSALLLLLSSSPSVYSADRVLNELFNQEQEFEQYYQLDISDLDKLPRPENIRKRQHWWPRDFEPLQKWESTGIKFAGYFHGSEYVEEFWTKPETTSLLVFFGDYPHASAKRKILRCYIPDVSKHPTWAPRAFHSLSNRNTRVVIYGRLVWDNYRTKDWVLVLNRIQVEQNNVMVDL